MTNNAASLRRKLLMKNNELNALINHLDKLIGARKEDPVSIEFGKGPINREWQDDRVVGKLVYVDWDVDYSKPFVQIRLSDAAGIVRDISNMSYFRRITGKDFAVEPVDILYVGENQVEASLNYNEFSLKDYYEFLVKGPVVDHIVVATDHGY